MTFASAPDAPWLTGKSPKKLDPKTFVNYADDPNYLPEALVLAAEAAKEQADYKTAARYCGCVVNYFPDSSVVDTAKGLLKQIKNSLK